MNKNEQGLTDFELKVFERQLSLPGFGVDAQVKLKHAAVFISRVGGLGGTVAMLLARAGIGRLVLAHGGHVEHENLNRMHLAFRDDLGKERMDTFKRTLHAINPLTDTVCVNEHVTTANIAHLVEQADILVDASPDFAERYCINAESVRTGKPMVMAAMNGLECYASSFIPGETPCLSCLYPQEPEGWEVLGFPVLATSSTFVASLAAMEVIKIICGIGQPLKGKLFYGDIENNNFSTFRVTKNDECDVCSRR
jgi:molybdopterin/thiamine biosynthesis adenylyltransferase